VGLFCHASQKTINEHLKFSVFSFFPVNTVIEFFLLIVFINLCTSR